MRPCHNSFLLCLSLLIASSVPAQDSLSRTPIRTGIYIAELDTVFTWRADIADTPRRKPSMLRVDSRSIAVMQWNSVTVLGIPADSVFLQYWRMHNRSGRRVFASIKALMDNSHFDEIRTVLEKEFGPPLAARTKPGRLKYYWRSKDLSIIVSNWRQRAAQDYRLLMSIQLYLPPR